MMVAYSFKSRFETAIAEGWKTQTIRRDRKRHARPGEMIQLYCGMRTRQCRKIRHDARCKAVLPIVIGFDPLGEIDSILLDGRRFPNLDSFARADGFTGVADMSAFWRAEQTPVGEWHGVLIQWVGPWIDPDDVEEWP